MIYRVVDKHGCKANVTMKRTHTLYDLHNEILKVFEIADGHLHAFFMDNRLWSKGNAFFSSQAEENDAPKTNEIKLESLNLSVGDAFIYLYDFGDEQIFNCTFISIDE